MSDDILARLRVVCLALPEVRERLSHGAPTWFMRGKVAGIVEDAYRLVAPKKLVAELDAPDPR